MQHKNKKAGHPAPSPMTNDKHHEPGLSLNLLANWQMEGDRSSPNGVLPVALFPHEARNKWKSQLKNKKLADCRYTVT